MLEYNDTGHGFPIVLLHGFCENRSVWKYCEAALALHNRVIAPDLPGFGESRLVETSVTMEYFAEQLKKLLDDLKIEKCIMVGHSFGGYVLLAFAEKYENRLAGMCLFHSTAFADTEEKKENRNKTIEFIEKYGVSTFAQSFVPPLFSLKNKTLFQREIEELVQAASASSEIGVIETTKAMRDRKDQTEVLKRVNVPVLFVVGKLDGAVPLEKSLEQCHLPKNSMAHFWEEAGHMGMIEKKQETVNVLRHFARFCSATLEQSQQA